MRLEFDVETRLPPEQVHAFFDTPADWPRPDERMKRVGQSVAAASLPELGTETA